MKKYRIGHRKRKKVSGKWLLGIAIVAIMVSSVFGIVLSGFGTQSNLLEYKGLIFIPNKYGTLTTTFNDNELIFVSSPFSVENINVSDKIISKLKNSKVITITYNPNSLYKKELAQTQFLMEQNLAAGFNTFTQRAVTNNTNLTSFLEASCQNATPTIPVIQLQVTGTSNYTLNNNCIIIDGYSGLDVLSRAERIIYGLMEVI